MSTQNHVGLLIVLCLVKVTIMVVCVCYRVEICAIFIPCMITTVSKAFHSERQYKQTHFATLDTARVTSRDDPKGFAECWDHLQTGDIVSFIMLAAVACSRVMRHCSTARLSGAAWETWNMCRFCLMKFQKQCRQTLRVFIMTSMCWAALLAAYNYCTQIGLDCHISQHMLKVANPHHDESF